MKHAIAAIAAITNWDISSLPQKNPRISSGLVLIGVAVQHTLELVRGNSAADSKQPLKHNFSETEIA